MKFGKTLKATVQARMPQWAEHVVQYKLLKRSIHQAIASRHTGDVSTEQMLVSFTHLIDIEVARVNNFYMDRIEEGVIILHALRQQGDDVVAAAAAMSGCTLAEQRHACKQSLVTFHLNLLILQNYVALNFMAIAKILKKWDKKTGLALRTEYISAIVELPFYQCQSLGQLVEDAEQLFGELDAISSGNDSTIPLKPVDAAPLGQCQPKQQWQQSQQQQVQMQFIS